MVNDPIADFLTRIKNGYLARVHEVSVPYSTMKEQLALMLVAEGYLAQSQIVKGKDVKHGNAKQSLVLKLRYDHKKPVVEQIRRISKPGARIYVDRHHIPWVLSGFGIAILSTPQGLLTDSKARKLGLGGEVICKVW